MNKLIAGTIPINKLRLLNYPLIIILVAAAILRLRYINQPFIDAFSWREASTAMIAENFYRTNWNIFYPEVSWNGPGPSYNGREFQTISYITALLYVVFGQHDWIGRSVAVAFGLWGIFALYYLIRLVWDEKHALAGAAVMAVLPGSVFVERSLIPDPAMVPLVTTSLWMLVAYLKTERLKYLWLASFFGAWGCLTKITGLIIGIPAIYAILSVLGAKSKRHSLKIFIIIAATTSTLIPVIAYYSWARYLAMNYPPYHFAGDGFWVWDGLQDWLAHKYYVPNFVRNLRNWSLTIPGMALVIFGLFCSPPRVQSDKDTAVNTKLGYKQVQIRWLFHWWLVGFVVFFLVGAYELRANVWNIHLFNPIAATLAGRTIIVVAVIAAKIVRSVLTDITQRFISKVPVVITILLVMILGISGQKALKSMYELPNWHSEQSYSLGMALHRNGQPNDLVITLAHALGDPVAIYYSHHRGWTFTLGGVEYPESRESDIILPRDDNISIQNIENLKKKGASLLGIVGVHQNSINKEHPLLLKYLKENLTLKEINSDWAVYRFISP